LTDLLATLISHNVPPYSRSGLYKELQSLREILTDYRSSTEESRSTEVIPLVIDLANKIGLFDDLPFQSSTLGKVTDSELVLNLLSSQNVGMVRAFVEEFNAFSEKLWNYMLELENRLFSEVCQ